MRPAGENSAASAAVNTPHTIGGCSVTVIDDLIAQLASTPWAVYTPETTCSAADALVWDVIRTIADRLGTKVPGRGDRTEQVIQPLDTFRAHPRSASAQSGLGTLPLHVECSHYARPCRYIVLGCLSAGRSGSATRLVDRANLKFEPDELALLRSVPLLVRSGRSSFYATILPRSGTYLRFDPNCMEALDRRGRAALDAVRMRLAEAPEQLLNWKNGQIVVIDNWRALHGRAASEAASGRRLARILVDG